MSEEPQDQSIATQIAEAQAAGDWDRSRALKHQYLDQQHAERRYTAEAPAVAEVPAAVAETEEERDAALRQQIIEAQDAGDWDRSRALKHQLTDRVNRQRRVIANGGVRR